MYNNRVVVYTSGTFDMFHSNHLKMIEYARGLGDTLIVGVSTDELVCSYKRPPVIPFEERIAILKALKYPDVVIPQRSLDHTELVKKLNIDVFVVAPNGAAEVQAFTAVNALREAGLKAAYDYKMGSMKSQMKAANRRNARFTVIFGEDELSRGCVTLRDMKTEDKEHNQKEIPLSDMTTILKTEVHKNE